ncbi:hypothetical protein NQ176_g3773 [Zarea fungicola]|uniref:Uncharacterized protein n=1 Tax=Zarea fungicola TaxID=93591 RepID=A0ACC1NGS2_9HYPO|nr:hypothetical protein NQ176_g3773 [Lecanicillium fungicola]
MDLLANDDLPVKTGEVHNHHQDSTVWNGFPFRNDDIIISTYAKSGTTWMQQIVGQLTQRGRPTVNVANLSPWVELRMVPREVMLQMLESQRNRRFMKTHLPVDALTWSSDVKYIFLARDARDMIWSLHHHLSEATPTFWSMINDTPGRKDLAHEMRRIADFLDIRDLSEDEWKASVEHSSFNWMKEHAELACPEVVAQKINGGAKSFINKGTNGRWADVISDEDNLRYLNKAKKELGEECANWLEKARMP